MQFILEFIIQKGIHSGIYYSKRNSFWNLSYIFYIKTINTKLTNSLACSSPTSFLLKAVETAIDCVMLPLARREVQIAFLIDEYIKKAIWISWGFPELSVTRVS
jgi:hypothetical protein